MFFSNSADKGSKFFNIIAKKRDSFKPFHGTNIVKRVIIENRSGVQLFFLYICRVKVVMTINRRISSEEVMNADDLYGAIAYVEMIFF